LCVGVRMCCEIGVGVPLSFLSLVCWFASLPNPSSLSFPTKYDSFLCPSNISYPAQIMIIRAALMILRRAGSGLTLLTPGGAILYSRLVALWPTSFFASLRFLLLLLPYSSSGHLILLLARARYGTRIWSGLLSDIPWVRSGPQYSSRNIMLLLPYIPDFPFFHLHLIHSCFLGSRTGMSLYFAFLFLLSCDCLSFFQFLSFFSTFVLQSLWIPLSERALWTGNSLLRHPIYIFSHIEVYQWWSLLLSRNGMVFALWV
jgi:hypothetical protein